MGGPAECLAKLGTPASFKIKEECVACPIDLIKKAEFPSFLIPDVLELPSLCLRVAFIWQSGDSWLPFRFRCSIRARFPNDKAKLKYRVMLKVFKVV